MKKIIIILICAFALYQLAAQNNYQGYYYANGRANYWRVDSTSANLNKQQPLQYKNNTNFQLIKL